MVDDSPLAPVANLPQSKTMIKVIGAKSPNCTDTEILVQFVVLHYTAVSLQRTLEIFSDSASQVSAHIVVGEDGSIHETVPCLGILDPNRTACRAWHAGVSRYTKSDGETTIEGFNDCSLGIELVNYNGNAFEFTDAQYSALKDIFQILFKRFPDIQNPESVLGHEDIAGFRGKVDPGHRFDWNRFYSENYPGKSAPIRKPVLEQSLLQPLQALCRHAPSDSKDRDAFYAAVSSFCETASATNKRP